MFQAKKRASLSNPRQVFGLPTRKRLGFTLVELLVVIAIIGVLVALLLPAVQAAREAARRLQCKNKVRQIALAVLNHESAIGTFPTGGSVPWPCIEHHSNGSSANGAPKQGLSWAFQVLPYLEQNAVHGLTTTEQMKVTPVSLYFCPSRRGPTQSYDEYWLNDYASATTAYIDALPGNDDDFSKYLYLNEQNTFWARSIEEIKDFSGTLGFQFMGVIVRTDWSVGNEQRKCDTLNNPDDDEAFGNTPPVTMAMIEDGTSNTLLIGEKRLASSRYDTGDWHDDRGWSDGWDPDTIRSTAFPVRADTVTPDDDAELKDAGSANRKYGFCFGSAHPGGINMSFADGSVHTINYDVEPELFNQLGNRADGAIVNLGEL